MYTSKSLKYQSVGLIYYKHSETEKFVEKLQGFQKKYLRGLAHGLKPVVFIGQKGITATLVHSIDEALSSHELIKVKFIDFKEKEHKRKIADMIEKQTGCEQAGMIGHTAILYRQHIDPKKRKIKIPKREP